jgi:Bacterial antitoxin of type II TA system, VapB
LGFAQLYRSGDAKPPHPFNWIRRMTTPNTPGSHANAGEAQVAAKMARQRPSLAPGCARATKWMHTMRTNIEINDKLMADAMRAEP